MSKILLSLIALVGVAVVLGGCSGESAPSDVKDIQAEMKNQTPADSPVLSQEQVGNDMVMRGGQKQGK